MIFNIQLIFLTFSANQFILFQMSPSPFRKALDLISSPKLEEEKGQSEKEEQHREGKEKFKKDEKEEEETIKGEKSQQNGGGNEEQLRQNGFGSIMPPYPLAPNFGSGFPLGGGLDGPDALAQLMANFAQQQQNGEETTTIGGNPTQIGHQMPDFSAAFLAQCPPPPQNGPPPPYGLPQFPHTIPFQQNGSQSGQIPPPHSSALPFPLPLDAATFAAIQHSFMLPPSEQRKKNATREGTAPLKHWLNEHRKNPYPTKNEKIALAVITRMTMTQVSTWFANARRRLKKENKMTWSPRNRPNEDDDEGEGEGEGENSNGEEHNNNLLLGMAQNGGIIPHQTGGGAAVEGPSSSSSPSATDQMMQDDQGRKRKMKMMRKNKKRRRVRGKKGIWSIADTLADDEEEEEEGENGDGDREEDEDEEEEEEEEENGSMNVKRRSREDGDEDEQAQKESSHRLNMNTHQSAECAAAGNGYGLGGTLQNGHHLAPPPPPHLLDGLFPAGGPFNGGNSIPPQLALTLGIPPEPNFLFAIAAAQAHNQHSHQMPHQNGIPNAPRLLPLNPFMLLAQHFMLNATVSATSANQPSLMKSNCEPMPATTGLMENVSFPIPPTSILPSLPPNLANNNPLSRPLASPTTTPLTIGQKRPKPMAQLDGLATMAKRQCQTKNCRTK